MRKLDLIIEGLTEAPALEFLDPYHAIGWDFDNTLIEHPNSSYFHAYIKAHPEKQHVIITMRTHGWQRQVFNEMRRLYGQAAPSRTDIAAVYNISDRAWELMNDARQLRQLGRLDGPLTRPELFYVRWKGLVCKLRSIPVMIDDKPEDTLPGCEKYGIKYVNPDEL